MIEFHFLPSRDVRIGDRWNTAGETFISTKGRQRYDATAKFDGWQMFRGTNCARLSVDGRLAATYQPPGRKLSPQDNSLKATLWIDRELQFPIGMSLDKQLWTVSSSSTTTGTNQPTFLPPQKIIHLHITTKLLSAKSSDSKPAPPTNPPQ
jgi:hypothetical protein